MVSLMGFSVFACLFVFALCVLIVHVPGIRCPSTALPAEMKRANAERGHF